MFFLPWWIYVLIGTVVFTSAFGGIWLAGIAFDRETEDETYPCLAHLGTDTDGAEDWCGQIHGHSGSHLGMRQYFDADETVFTREWPEEDGVFQQTNAAGDVVIDENPGYLPGSEPVSFTTMNGVTTSVDADGSVTELPPLPQRLSKVPVQPEHNDPWQVCGHSNMNGTCDLAKGHPGDHSFMCY